MDKRQHPRFPARFHSSFTSVTMVSGEGNVVDLSLRGCCVESETPVHPGSTLTIRVHILPDEPPITVLEPSCGGRARAASVSNSFPWFLKNGLVCNTL